MILRRRRGHNYKLRFFAWVINRLVDKFTAQFARKYSPWFSDIGSGCEMEDGAECIAS